MHATEAHFRCLADALPQLVCVVDETGRVSYGNPTWCEFMGIGAGSPFLASFLPALHPGDRPLWERTWGQAVASGGPYVFERRVRHRPRSYHRAELEPGESAREGECCV